MIPTLEYSQRDLVEVESKLILIIFRKTALTSRSQRSAKKE